MNFQITTKSCYRNTEGTINGPSRVHKFSITFTPNSSATVANPSPPNLLFTYLDTILFTGPNGTPTTGLDPDAVGSIQFQGFPPLPVATFQGDGFGRAGPGGKAIPVDGEGLVLNKDGSFWVSDEYGPYIYKFSPAGAMLEAIRPPNAILPIRNGTVSFSAASASRYDPSRKVLPKDPSSGRNNNQGLEGLTLSKDGKTLYALMQSALNQEGGPNNPGRRPARLLEYDLKHGNPEYVGEYVVLLPLWSDPTVSDPTKRTKVAAQSEIHHLGDDKFLILARDSGAGNGLPSTTSIYRHVDIFSLTGATNIKSASNDATGASIASAAGVLKSGINPAKYCPWLDFNINSELNKFGVTNGGPSSPNLSPLNEKWEGLALVPVHGSKDEHFLISLSDNDFITQNGFIDFGEIVYRDASGANLNNQALVFQVKLPKGEGKHDDDDDDGSDDDESDKKHKRGGRAWGCAPAEDEKDKRGGGAWGGSPAEDEKDKRGRGAWGGSPAEDEKDKRGGNAWGGSPA